MLPHIQLLLGFILASLIACDLQTSPDPYPTSHSSFRLMSKRNLEAYTRPSFVTPFNSKRRDVVAVPVVLSPQPAPDNSYMTLEIGGDSTLMNMKSGDFLFKSHPCTLRNQCKENSKAYIFNVSYFKCSNLRSSNDLKVTIGDSSLTLLQTSNIRLYHKDAECDTSFELFYSRSTYGIMGLSALNFARTALVFSVLVENINSGEGWIMFNEHKQYTSPQRLLFTIDGDELFQKKGFMLLLNGQAGPSEIYSRTFSLNYGKLTGSCMSVPKATFSFLLNTLEGLGIPYMNCSDINCSCLAKDVVRLPPIQYKGMYIPSAVYMSDNGDGSYTTNFLESKKPGFTPTLVFGWKVLSMYYTVFNSTRGIGSNIAFYLRPDGLLSADGPTSTSPQNPFLRESTSNKNPQESGSDTAIYFNTDIKESVAIQVIFSNENPTTAVSLKTERIAKAFMTLELGGEFPLLDIEYYRFLSLKYGIESSLVPFSSPYLICSKSLVAQRVSIDALNDYTFKLNKMVILDGRVFCNTTSYYPNTSSTSGIIPLSALGAYQLKQLHFSLLVHDARSGEGWIKFGPEKPNDITPNRLLFTLDGDEAFQKQGFTLLMNGEIGPFERHHRVFSLNYGKMTGSCMAVPQATFTFLLKILSMSPYVKCIANMSCSCLTKDVDKLPPIQYKKMYIPSSVYMTEVGNGTSITNFQLSETTRGFEPRLMFGWKILSMYYTVFDAVKGVGTNISFYIRPDGLSSTNGPTLVSPPNPFGAGIDVPSSSKSSAPGTSNMTDAANSTSPNEANKTDGTPSTSPLDSNTTNKTNFTDPNGITHTNLTKPTDGNESNTTNSTRPNDSEQTNSTDSTNTTSPINKTESEDPKIPDVYAKHMFFNSDIKESVAIQVTFYPNHFHEALEGDIPDTHDMLQSIGRRLEITNSNLLPITPEKGTTIYMSLEVGGESAILNMESKEIVSRIPGFSYRLVELSSPYLVCSQMMMFQGGRFEASNSYTFKLRRIYVYNDMANCEAASYYPNAKTTSGIIALSVMGDDQPNQLHFSFLVHDARSGEGWIKFGPDASNNTIHDRLLFTFDGDEAFQKQGFALLMNGEIGPVETYHRVFSINYGKMTGSCMAVPHATFIFLLKTLSMSPYVTCTTNVSCSCLTNDTHKLPPIQYKKMYIPSSMYMTDLGNGTSTTNFQLSEATRIFKPKLVFGWKVLSMYYTVFDAVKGVGSNISFYLRPDGLPSTDGPTVVHPSNPFGAGIDVPSGSNSSVPGSSDDANATSATGPTDSNMTDAANSTKPAEWNKTDSAPSPSPAGSNTSDTTPSTGPSDSDATNTTNSTSPAGPKEADTASPTSPADSKEGANSTSPTGPKDADATPPTSPAGPKEADTTSSTSPADPKEGANSTSPTDPKEADTASPTSPADPKEAANSTSPTGPKDADATPPTSPTGPKEADTASPTSPADPKEGANSTSPTGPKDADATPPTSPADPKEGTTNSTSPAGSKEADTPSPTSPADSKEAANSTSPANPKGADTTSPTSPSGSNKSNTALPTGPEDSNGSSTPISINSTALDDASLTNNSKNHHSNLNTTASSDASVAPPSDSSSGGSLAFSIIICVISTIIIALIVYFVNKRKDLHPVDERETINPLDETESTAISVALLTSTDPYKSRNSPNGFIL